MNRRKKARAVKIYDNGINEKLQYVYTFFTSEPVSNETIKSIGEKLNKIPV